MHEDGRKLLVLVYLFGLFICLSAIFLYSWKIFYTSEEVTHKLWSVNDLIVRFSL